MLGHDEEVLLEDFISAENMTKIERDICMLYVSNIKDIADSDVGEIENTKFDIIKMSFIKNPEYITFNGAVSNGEEVRTVFGSIVKEGRSICLKSHFGIENLGIYYSTVDLFRNGSGSTSRKSRYVESDIVFKDNVSLNINDLIDYYRSLIGKGRVL